MATSLIHHERIMTTTARAKELRRFVEKLVKFGKRGDNHGFREAMRVLKEESAGVKLMEILGPRYMYVFYSRFISCLLFIGIEAEDTREL